MTTTDREFEARYLGDRVHYAAGILLDAEDFRAEQTYHRGSLARALLYFFGSGTVAGLAVQWEGPLPPSSEFPEGREERLIVQPGIATDRFGRVVEVPRPWCLPLAAWYTAQDTSQLKQGFHGPPADGVIADVFLRFAVCERGKTPAFATGPYDAIDAEQPSRLRDAHHLELVIRTEEDPKLPQTRWRRLNGDSTVAELHQAILDPETWADTRRNAEGKPEKLPEHRETQDPSDLFLARVTIPADGVGAEGQPPPRTAGQDVLVDNLQRAFVYTPAALAQLAGITFESNL